MCVCVCYCRGPPTVCRIFVYLFLFAAVAPSVLLSVCARLSATVTDIMARQDVLAVCLPVTSRGISADRVTTMFDGLAASLPAHGVWVYIGVDADDVQLADKPTSWFRQRLGVPCTKVVFPPRIRVQVGHGADGEVACLARREGTNTLAADGGGAEVFPVFFLCVTSVNVSVDRVTALGGTVRVSWSVQCS